MLMSLRTHGVLKTLAVHVGVGTLVAAAGVGVMVAFVGKAWMIPAKRLRVTVNMAVSSILEAGKWGYYCVEVFKVLFRYW